MRNYCILLAFSLFVCTSAQDSLKIKTYKETEGKIHRIYVDNEEIVPISAEYVYTTENLSSSRANNSVFVIPAKTKKHLVSELTTIDKTKKIKFSYNLFNVLGDVNVKSAESNYVYQLPFAIGKKYSIYQGYNGSFSHQHKNSLDFSLNIGEKVYAARSGLVVKVLVGSNKSCITKDCAVYNNKIVILHDDGTLAEYVHLQKGGAVVKEGQQVTHGQHIGFSGNTGWSKGPHLHFSVYVNKIDADRNYIKTKFHTAESKLPIYLQEKKTYTRKK